MNSFKKAVGLNTQSDYVGHHGLMWLMIGAVLATTLGAASLAHAGTVASVVIGTMKDNTLYESTTGSLSNGSGEQLFAGVTGIIGGAAIRRGLLAFDITGAIPAGSLITSVDLTLQMTRTSFGSGAQTVSLHRLTQDWGEGASNATFQEGSGIAAESGDATWLHTFYATDFWQVVGGDFDPVASASLQVDGLGAYTWGSSSAMVSDVQGWLTTPGSNAGWIIIGGELSFGTTKRFASRENLNAVFRPMLSVTFTPPVFCQGDANGNNTVNFADITSVLANWLNVYTPGTGPGDANGDGVVNFADITAVLGNWLSNCP